MVEGMNSSGVCLYNESSCFFVDVKGNCLSNVALQDLIHQYVQPTYYEWICIVLYVVVFFVGTIGNLLVIIVIRRNRSMRTVTNMFIMNLAAADLLVLVFCLPATVVQDVTKTWFFGLILCKFVNYVQNMSISVSVLTLMAISIERYQAIVHPLKFSGTKQRARTLIISVWTLSLLLVLPDAVMMTVSRHFGDRVSTIYLTYCQWNVQPLVDLLYQLHISLFLFIIPLGLMVYTYTSIARVLWGSLPSERIFYEEIRKNSTSQLSRSDESHTSSSRHSTKSANLVVQENRQKAAKMLISVVIIFVICYIPVHAFNLVRHVIVYLESVKSSPPTGDQVCFIPTVVYLERTGTTKIITITALLAHFLPYFNSSINPIIYNIMSDKFRLKFRELFSSCCCCCCRTVKRTKSTSSTMMHYKSSGNIQHSPISTNQNNNHRSSLKKTLPRTSTPHAVNFTNDSASTLANVTRHPASNVYAHNEPISFRLTNV